MAGLDRLVLIESVAWDTNIHSDPIADSDRVLQSWTVWASKRDLGVTLEYNSVTGRAQQTREAEYTIRYIDDLANYLRATDDGVGALRITEGDLTTPAPTSNANDSVPTLRLVVTNAEDGEGRGRYLALQCRTPLPGEAGSSLPWKNYGAAAA